MTSGIIIINAYGVPEQSVRQAERLKAEFALLDCNVDIVRGRVAGIIGGEYYRDFKAADFIVYLDKDKYLSEALENLGARLFNSHAAIRVCDDKAKTCIALAKAGIKVPDTIFAPVCYKAVPTDSGFLTGTAQKLGYPVVVKESYGSMGKGVFLARDYKELVETEKNLQQKPHIFQRYLGKKKGEDTRVIVIGGRAVAAIKRKNETDFRSNVAAGGKGSAITLTDAQRQTAESAAKVLGLDYCGVDLLTGDSGEPVVCEVNSNAFFEEAEKVSGVNIAALYAKYILDSIK